MLCLKMVISFGNLALDQIKRLENQKTSNLDLNEFHLCFQSS